MSKFKVLLIPIATFLGALLGYFLAPPQPMYPFAPARYELELIYYTELHIIIYLGFFSACLTFFFSKILNTTLYLAVGSLVAVGLFIGAIDELRNGVLPYYSIRELITYIIGCFILVWYSLFYILAFLIKSKWYKHITSH